MSHILCHLRSVSQTEETLLAGLTESEWDGRETRQARQHEGLSGRAMSSRSEFPQEEKKLRAFINVYNKAASEKIQCFHTAQVALERFCIGL